MNFMRRGSLFAISLATCFVSSSALAVVYPFTEHFDAGTADWRNNATAALTSVASGGIADSAYVITDFAFTSATNPQVALFRGHDGFNSSGDAFVGNWLTTGVSRLTAFVRHDAPVPLDFFVRIARPANSPAVSFTQPQPVPAGSSWTRLDFDISFDNPLRTNEGPPTLAFYNGVMADVGNVQIGAVVPMALATDPQPYSFDLDRVAIVPEPAGMLLASIGALAILIRRRRK